MGKATQQASWEDRDQFEDESIVENEDDIHVAEEDFSRLLIAPTDWTVGTIYDLIGKQIQLNPEYQRRNVWQVKAKSQFIESLLLGIPIPQILLASKAGQKNAFLVLDGKQRLTTIKEFLDGAYTDGREFKLRDLRVLKQLNDMSWSSLKKDPEWSGRILNESLRTSVLRGWENESILYEIFYRLNSGSVKLSPMELRMSLLPGGFLKFIISWTENIGPIHKLLRKRQPDARMSDVELSIRYLAFQDANLEYAGDLKQFLDEFCKRRNSEFSSDSFASDRYRGALEIMNSAIDIGFVEFGDRDFCRKYVSGTYESRFNRAIFDVLVGSLSDSAVRDWVRLNPGSIKRLFEEVCSSSPEFIQAIETTTKSTTSTRNRFSIWYDALSRVAGLHLDMPKVK